MDLYWVSRNEEIVCVASWWRHSEWVTVIYPVSFNSVIPEAIWVGTEAEAKQLVESFATNFKATGFQAEPIPPLFRQYIEEGKVAAHLMSRLFRPDGAVFLERKESSYFTLAQLFGDISLFQRILDMPAEYLRERPWEMNLDLLGLVRWNDCIFYERDEERRLDMDLDRYRYFLYRPGTALPPGQWRLLGTFAQFFAEIRDFFKVVKSRYTMEEHLDMLYRGDINYRISFFSMPLFFLMLLRERKGNIVTYI